MKPHNKNVVRFLFLREAEISKISVVGDNAKIDKLDV